VLSEHARIEGEISGVPRGDQRHGDRSGAFQRFP
jgi:hypothetical protein